MTKDTVIKVENVSKKYCRELKHTMLYGIEDIARNAIGLCSRSESLRDGEFWAVDNISLEVKRGESIGIIGANGSGKSTVLKLLNGIFMPDKGRIEIKGRVGALIEIGAGFHPMLTGRENIYINGAILGMSKREIDKKFDEIVDFADIGDFLDSPVKHYSSGMYVRLGFAVAVHCDPDILLIDEVLAVGDARFRHRCYQKLREFRDAGKTILLVTHDHEAVVRHCNNVVLLHKGTVLRNGGSNEVVNCYLEMILAGTSSFIDKGSDNTAPQRKRSAEGMAIQSPLEKFLGEVPPADNCINRNSYSKNEHRFGDMRAALIDYIIVCGENHEPTVVYSGDIVDFYLKARFNRDVEFPMFGFAIKSVDGIMVYGNNTRFSETFIRPATQGHIIIFKFSMKLNLQEGDYFVDMCVTERLPDSDEAIDMRYELICLHVNEKYRFAGLVKFETIFEEVSRKGLNQQGSHVGPN